MKARFAIGSSVFALALLGGAMAGQTPTAPASDPNDKTSSAQTGSTANIVSQIATVAQQSAQFAATTAVIAEPNAATTAPPETAPPVPAQKIAAPAKNAAAPAQAAAKPKRLNGEKIVEQANVRKVAPSREQVAAAAPRPMLVRSVGKPETGSAAWYGGRHVGQRTTSGEPLDTVHMTAAHRSLPLNSLARVTNLQNGCSVVVRVTDRGPIHEDLLIDMSPRAAEELHMKAAGVVPVKVEPVVEVASDTK